MMNKLDLTVKVADVLAVVTYLERIRKERHVVLDRRGDVNGYRFSDLAFAECIGCMKSLCEQAAVEAGLLEEKVV